MAAQRTGKFLLVAIALTLLNQVHSLACACCAEEGEYFKAFRKIEDSERGLMKQMHFGDKAFLFLTEADLEEDARGIPNPKENYSLSGSLFGNAWRLSFRDGATSGALRLPLPLKMESYRVDIRDGKQSGGGGPLLYKEWRFEGLVNGSGLFKSGLVGPTRYFLVLQGRGNSCDNAEDFTNWRLEVTGKKARFAFYGAMAKPS